MMDFLTEQLGNDLTISPEARFLKKHGLISLALYWKNMNDVRERRASRVTRWALENVPLPEVRPGQRLYFGMGENAAYRKIPGDDANGIGLRLGAWGNYMLDEDHMDRLYDLAENRTEWLAADQVIRDARASWTQCSPTRYLHGGLHNVPNVAYVLEHGFRSYQDRIAKRMEGETDVCKRSFLEGLMDVAVGVQHLLERSRDDLARQAAETADPQICRMAKAMKTLAEGKPETFYEAYLAADVVLSLAGYEPGRIDSYLYPFYQRDLQAGKTSKEEAVSLFEEMFADIDRNTGHPGVVHVTIGGTDARGNGVYNDLTEAAILAIRGHRTPNLTLRVRPDMPQFIWDAALSNIGKGDSHPALYNDTLVLERLVEDYRIPREDAVNYVFGGCSELMIQGMSTCNSTWVAYNMLDVLEHTIYNYLLVCRDFDDFCRQYQADLKRTLHELAEHIRLREFHMAQNQSACLRSLFTEGCIAHARGALDGGSQYNFDSTNIYGGTNAINSLYTIRLVLEGRLPISREELLSAMADNFEGHEKTALLCRRAPKFGNENPEIEALTREVMDTVFTAVMQENTYRKNEDFAGRFMPGIILWVDWVYCGERVGATPDGRVRGEALADSAGPMQGTDSRGPTASMLGTLAVPQEKCAGTCVMNLRLDPANFKTTEGRTKVQQLFQGYLAQGGIQLQVSVVDGEALLDALKEPDKHRDLIVRVGGFSDNFVMLDSKIQQQIIRRTVHNV